MFLVEYVFKCVESIIIERLVRLYYYDYDVELIYDDDGLFRIILER